MKKCVTIKTAQFTEQKQHEIMKWYARMTN